MLCEANAVKVAIVLALTFAVRIAFQANGQILWLPGLVLGVGNMIGAWFGDARLAVRKGTVWVRWFVIVVVLVSAMELLGVFDWVVSSGGVSVFGLVVRVE